MRICLITFHFAHNNGALLQCYGLYKYLVSQGHHVEVIDYQPPYHEQLFVKNPNPFVLARRAYMEQKGKKLVVRLYRYARRFAGVLLHYNNEDNMHKQLQMEAWEQFSKRSFVFTRRYRSIKELRKDPPKADVYISGSDQLWNPFLTDFDLDPAYFLDFGPANVKRITYAISACQLDVFAYKDKLQKYCKNLQSLSLRENEKKADIEKITGQKVTICPDPTFLIDTEMYGLLEEELNGETENYVLVYLMGDSVSESRNKKLVLELVSELGVKGIDISMQHRDWNSSIESHNGVSLGEYLKYIKNAKYVITNSFHCTAFSINYHRQFVTIPISGKSSRTEELLRSMFLTHRLINSDDEVINIMLDKIDYHAVDKQRKEIQYIGREYLNSFFE